MSDPNAYTPVTPTKHREGGGLSPFLKVSIVMLAGLALCSIALLFVGDFSGKFDRVFATFLLFALFTVFTAIDTRVGAKSDWYAPLALIANAYILALLLMVIWMTPYVYFGLFFEIFGKSIFVIFVVRLVVLCCQLLLLAGSKVPEAVTQAAFVTSALAVLSGILFTAPVGVEIFGLDIPDLYWKISVAVLILAALGLSITLLLRWTYGAEQREAARAARAQLAADSHRAPGAPYRADVAAGEAVAVAAQPEPQGLPVWSETEFAQQQAWVDRDRAQPAGMHSLTGPAEPHASQAAQVAQPAQAQQVEPHAPSAGQQAQQAEQSYLQQAQPLPSGLLPWPTLADGRPLPAGPDGQPDFSALNER